MLCYSLIARPSHVQFLIAWSMHKPRVVAYSILMLCYSLIARSSYVQFLIAWSMHKRRVIASNQKLDD